MFVSHVDCARSDLRKIQRLRFRLFHRFRVLGRRNRVHEWAVPHEQSYRGSICVQKGRQGRAPRHARRAAACRTGPQEQRAPGCRAAPARTHGGDGHVRHARTHARLPPGPISRPVCRRALRGSRPASTGNGLPVSTNDGRDAHGCTPTPTRDANGYASATSRIHAPGNARNAATASGLHVSGYASWYGPAYDASAAAGHATAVYGLGRLLECWRWRWRRGYVIGVNAVVVGVKESVIIIV